MILVVDDQPDAGRMLCRLLDRCGFQCHYSESADEALQFLTTIRPTLAILDVMMPETDGLTLLEQIRARRELAGLPVMFYSASTDATHRRRAADLNADAYLVKGSVDVVELLGVVTRYDRAGQIPA